MGGLGDLSSYPRRFTFCVMRYANDDQIDVVTLRNYVVAVFGIVLSSVHSMKVAHHYDALFTSILSTKSAPILAISDKIASLLISTKSSSSSSSSSSFLDRFFPAATGL